MSFLPCRRTGSHSSCRSLRKNCMQPRALRSLWCQMPRRQRLRPSSVPMQPGSCKGCQAQYQAGALAGAEPADSSSAEATGKAMHALSSLLASAAGASRRLAAWPSHGSHQQQQGPAPTPWSCHPSMQNALCIVLLCQAGLQAAGL